MHSIVTSKYEAELFVHIHTVVQCPLKTKWKKCTLAISNYINKETRPECECR